MTTTIIKPLKFSRDKTLPCPVCAEKSTETILTYQHQEGTSDICKCPGCGHGFIFPIPVKNISARQMGITSDPTPTLRFLKEKLVISNEIRCVRKYLPMRQPRLLDIGCGTGWTTAIWKNNGFAVSGIELSPASRDICKQQYGFPVFAVLAEEMNFQDEFDVIIMEHALEHIETPADLLAKINAALKTGGVLLISVPNFNSAGRFIFREKWAWGLPYHLHFFSPRSLIHLVRGNGFDKVFIYQSISPLYYLGVLADILKGLPSLQKAICSNYRYLTLAIITLLIWPLPFFGKGDNITIICQKSS